MRLDEIAEREQAKSKMVYDKEENTINFRKQKCTDTKHNTRLTQIYVMRRGSRRGT